MKLDSIVYDINTLKNALTEQTVLESSTFKSMYPSDTATSLMTVLAGYGSMLQYQLVSAMANCYTDTAYSETGVYQLAETLGNRLHGNVSSSINVSVTRNNLRGVTDLVIPANCVWNANGIKFYNPSAIFFGGSEVTHNNTSLVQGEYKVYKSTTSGTSYERIYFSKDFKCDNSKVRVFVNDEEWEISETFLPYNYNNLIDSSEMKVVILRTDPDGRTYIKFGNNKNGLVPISNSVVEIRYIDNDGINGNIASDSINIELVTPIYHYYDGNSVLLDVSVSNTTVAAGGYSVQSPDVLRETSPYVFASGERAVRREDYKALLINKCGYITANVWGEYEESQYEGYFDKSMMNLVYYTGIKQLQHYDYKPMGEISDVKLVGNDLLNNPYSFKGNIGTIKGFPGSYILDFTYSLDKNVRLRYRDQFGTGILTCDPSENNNDSSLYPFNDLGESLEGNNSKIFVFDNEIHFPDYQDPSTGTPLPEEDIEQRIRDNVSPIILNNLSNWTGNITSVFKENNTNTFVWDGFNSKGRAKKVGFDNPVRLYFSFDDTCPTPIAAFAFRCPSNMEALKNCPCRFAVYATNENTETAPIDQTRNSFYWKRIVDITKIEFNVNTGFEENWTDWYTTKLYNSQDDSEEEQKNSGVSVIFKNWKPYKRYVIEFYTFQDEEESTAEYGKAMFIPGVKALYANTNVDYYSWQYVSGVISSQTIPNNKFSWEPGKIYLTTANIIPTSPPEQNEIFIQTDGEQYPKNYFEHNGDVYQYKFSEYDNITKLLQLILVKKVVTAGVIEWIEQDGGKRRFFLMNSLSEQQTIHEERGVSTIDYTNNDYVSLYVPQFPVDMKYFQYKTTITGITNDYNKGDKLYAMFPSTTGEGELYFHVTVLNPNTGSAEVYFSHSKAESVSGLLMADNTEINKTVDLSYNDTVPMPPEDARGNGAQIKVESIPTINLYAHFTGNSYTLSDIQRLDEPIIEQYNHFTTYVEFKQPKIKHAKVVANVEYEENVDVQKVEGEIRTAISKVFDVTPYFIGQDVTVNKIWQAIQSVPNVKRFIVTYPTEDIHCEQNELLLLNDSNITINNIIGKTNIYK